MPTAPVTTVKALGFLREKAAGDTSGPPVFRLSNGVLDRHRDRVRPASISVEEYNANNVLLWNHDDCQPAIGTARVYRDGEEWLMEPSFDLIGDLSKEVAAKVTAGTLKSCSFKFVIDGYEPNAEGGLDYTAVRVVEVSITNVPANQESLRLKNNTPPTPAPEDTTPPPPPPSKALEQADLDAVSALLDEKLAPIVAALQALTDEETTEMEEPAPPAPPPPSEAELAAKSFTAVLQGRK
ncbi:MAG: HK97 family phage prohead protease [Hyalangium sp.]|uniref:HK97 family phage prohead protease n=1 Tax=Hyalangium sp. TaxID=2028555 RepID=UPI00389A55F1